MQKYLLICFLTGTLSNQTASAQINYFPPGCLDKTPPASKFKEEWYSKNLQALKEPPLWKASENQKGQSYRFLWLRTFHRPVSVRLDVNPDGSGLLTTKIAGGAGGYDPGRLVANKVRGLTKRETTWFLDRIEELGFWNLPTIEESDVIGVDGARWIIEGVNDEKYKIVDRWSPKKGPIHILGIIMLIDLAKLKLLYEEVY